MIDTQKTQERKQKITEINFKRYTTSKSHK